MLAGGTASGAALLVVAPGARSGLASGAFGPAALAVGRAEAAGLSVGWAGAEAARGVDDGVTVGAASREPLPQSGLAGLEGGPAGAPWLVATALGPEAPGLGAPGWAGRWGQALPVSGAVGEGLAVGTARGG